MDVEMPGFDKLHKQNVVDMKKKVIDYVKEVRRLAGHNPGQDMTVPISDTTCITYNEDGYPILVGYDRQKPLSKAQIEPLVRTYLVSHYCKFK